MTTLGEAFRLVGTSRKVGQSDLVVAAHDAEALSGWADVWLGGEEHCHWQYVLWAFNPFGMP